MLLKLFTLKLIIGIVNFILLFQAQVHQQERLTVIKSKETIPESEIQPGPSNISIPSHVASPLSTRLFPVPRQSIEKSMDTVEEITKETIP